MSELVDEVEDQGRYAIVSEVRREPGQQGLTVGRGEYLLVVHRHLAPGQVLELLDHQLRFMSVQAGIVVVPPPCRDSEWQAPRGTDR